MKFSDERPSIVCPKCKLRSYNINDIRQAYCGNCHLFHEEIFAAIAKHYREQTEDEAVAEDEAARKPNIPANPADAAAPKRP